MFELIPTAKTPWKEKVLYSFCAEANCADGVGPFAGLIRDASGNLYGTTTEGGAFDGGTVFELTPAAKTPWPEKVLYSFCAEKHCADGATPYAGLIRGASGNLYGTTNGGGGFGQGTVFELTPAAKTPWLAKVLYSFCAKANCADGAGPYAGLIKDASGNLYGTTFAGGKETTGMISCEAFGKTSISCGVIFELTPNHARTKWTEAVLHVFCKNGGDCVDGANPYAALIRDGSGDLYATALFGSGEDAGTVIELER